VKRWGPARSADHRPGRYQNRERSGPQVPGADPLPAPHAALRSVIPLEHTTSPLHHHRRLGSFDPPQRHIDKAQLPPLWNPGQILLRDSANRSPPTFACSAPTLLPIGLRGISAREVLLARQRPSTACFPQTAHPYRPADRDATLCSTNYRSAATPSPVAGQHHRRHRAAQRVWSTTTASPCAPPSRLRTTLAILEQ